MKAFLDTHAVVFLWEAERERFGTAALELLDRSALFVSPIVRLELALLHEIGRIAPRADEVLGALASEVGLAESDDRLAEIVRESLRYPWTRDPFDRVLVATAALHRAPLITRDDRIRAHFDRAVW